MTHEIPAGCRFRFGFSGFSAFAFRPSDFPSYWLCSSPAHWQRFAQTKTMNDSTNHLEVATLGGGCFWCTEAIFQMLPGVKSVTSGYAGGTKENPTYKEVCTGNTGHAEVIQIKYDPKVVSYEKLLETFWEAHDPTTLNRQGPDARHAIPLDHSLQQRSPEGWRRRSQKPRRRSISASPS